MKYSVLRRAARQLKGDPNGCTRAPGTSDLEIFTRGERRKLVKDLARGEVIASSIPLVGIAGIASWPVFHLAAYDYFNNSNSTVIGTAVVLNSVLWGGIIYGVYKTADVLRDRYYKARESAWANWDMDGKDHGLSFLE